MLVKNRTSNPQSAHSAGSLDLQNLKDRIKLVAGLQGGNSALARSIDSAESTVRKWIKGDAEPKYNSLVSIANATNVSLEWLMSGAGEMRVQGAEKKNDKLGEARATYGGREVRAEVLSSNMEPTLCPGDEIGTEPSQVPVSQIQDGIYLIRVGDNEGIWRLQSTPDKRLWLLNDNPKYQHSNTAIDLSEAENLEVIARVVWVRHKL
jgi:phage repressor protein C with HTH and peptisase S24 domain